MSQYKTGTVNVINGSAVVTGISTLFVANLAVGDIFTVVGDGIWYSVGSVDSDTQITLSGNYAGATVSSAYYAVTRDFTPNLNLPYPVSGDIETAAIIKRALLDIDGGIHRAMTPATATATGVAGAVVWDANYIYVCVATNTWKRTAIASW